MHYPHYSLPGPASQRSNSRLTRKDAAARPPALHLVLPERRSRSGRRRCRRRASKHLLCGCGNGLVYYKVELVKKGWWSRHVGHAYKHFFYTTVRRRELLSRQCWIGNLHATRLIATVDEKLSARIRSSLSIGLHTTTTLAGRWVALNWALHICRPGGSRPSRSRLATFGRASRPTAG